MKTLGLEPFIHPTARVHESALGRYTEVGAGCHVSRSRLGDYSYCVENTQIAYATIGKFANIAAHVRIYASKHPMERASLHHFTYRSSWYFEGEHLPSSSKRSRRWSGWISPRRRCNGRRRCRAASSSAWRLPGR